MSKIRGFMSKIRGFMSKIRGFMSKIRGFMSKIRGFVGGAILARAPCAGWQTGQAHRAGGRVRVSRS
jgi:hypothetical protein